MTEPNPAEPAEEITDEFRAQVTEFMDNNAEAMRRLAAHGARELRQRRVIVSLGQDVLTHLLSLPSGAHIGGIREDWLTDSIQVLVIHPDLPPVADLHVPPNYRGELSLNEDGTVTVLMPELPPPPDGSPPGVHETPSALCTCQGYPLERCPSHGYPEVRAGRERIGRVDPQ